MCTACSGLIWLIPLSMALFAWPIVAYYATKFAKWLYGKCTKQPFLRRKSGNISIWFWFSLAFILASAVLRYAVTRYGMHHPMEGVDYAATWPEQMLDSLLRAVRTVGVPEDYTIFIDQLRAMLAGTMPQAYAWTHNWIIVYDSVLNVAIPVAGSALILGVFARAFPKVLLWFKCLLFWREKCYFSGLNPQTVALAKSILVDRQQKKSCWRPLLIFTDAYVDDEMEQSFELMLEAKRLGAVCLRDDLAHIRKARFGARSYFLMEEDEYANLPALMGLVEERNVPCMKKAAIYLFVGSNLYERLEKNIRERLTAPEKKPLRERWTEMEGKSFFEKVRVVWNECKTNRYKLMVDDLPLLVPVNAHRNLMNNLMVDVPLYEPLVGTDKTELGITILGNGAIGTEAFLSAYWFGQIQCCPDGKTMKPCDLRIHVVSQDTEATFWDKIDYFNPEIRRTCDGSDAVLDWAPDQKNPPYASVKYYRSNVKMGSMGENREWLKSDYFIIALGSDADNIAVAEKLRTHIGKQHEEAAAAAKTVIAYVVYDTDLCRALNARSQVEYGVYMHAFGHLEQVYGSDNVFMTRSRVLADQTGNAYQQRSSLTHLQEQKARSNEKGNYNHWSSLARAMHITYKIFSMGWITTSLFEDEAKHREEMLALKRRYARVCGIAPEHLADKDKEWRSDLEEKKEYLGYLEHRRWNAFIRSLGYRKSTRRNFSLKLHPCLVETRGPQAADPYLYMTEEKLDYLDDVGDYKAYDYPYDDVGKLIPLCRVVKWNTNADGSLKAPALTAKELHKRCKKAASAGVYRDVCQCGEDWMIPVAHLKAWLGNDLYEQMKKEMH